MTRKKKESWNERVPGWTEGRFRSFVTSALRGAFRRFPNKFGALREAAAGIKTNKATGRQAKHYTCANCGDDFPSNGVHVDHLKPIVGVEGFKSWDDFIDKLFCSVDNLQILCIPCHKLKTKEENEARKRSK